MPSAGRKRAPPPRANRSMRFAEIRLCHRVAWQRSMFSNMRFKLTVCVVGSIHLTVVERSAKPDAMEGGHATRSMDGSSSGQSGTAIQQQSRDRGRRAACDVARRDRPGEHLGRPLPSSRHAAELRLRARQHAAVHLSWLGICAGRAMHRYPRTSRSGAAEDDLRQELSVGKPLRHRMDQSVRQPVIVRTWPWRRGRLASGPQPLSLALLAQDARRPCSDRIELGRDGMATSSPSAWLRIPTC